MSYGDSSAFTSNNEFDRSFDTSYGPSQSTQATDVSDYSNTGVADRQSRNNAADEGLFQNVGYGTNQFGVPATNSSTAFGNYVYPATNPTTPGYIQEPQVRSVHEQPWSGLPLLHQFDPSPVIRGATASGPRQLGYPVYMAHAMYDVQSSTVPSTASSNNGPIHQQSNGMIPFDPNQNIAVSQQYTSSSNQQQKLPIARLPSSPRSRDTKSDSGEPKTLYWCKLPDCGKPFTRSDSLDRHHKTIHEIGPFWLCEICRHWEHNVRLDKMWEHCRQIHNHDPLQAEYPCRLVESVGVQNHVPKVSTNGKATRRRKKRVTEA